VCLLSIFPFFNIKVRVRVNVRFRATIKAKVRARVKLRVITHLVSLNFSFLYMQDSDRHPVSNRRPILKSAVNLTQIGGGLRCFGKVNSSCSTS
jgi:hypothetical protein